MNKPRLSVSSWSLHRNLGGPPIYGPEAGRSVPSFQSATPPKSTLLELPTLVAQAGIHTLEICHFHLPTRDTTYLHELRAALADANVSLFSLLIDAGDITHPKTGAEDLLWIADWLPVAETLGATCVRVIAGKSEPSPESLRRSREGLQTLAKQAREHGVRLMTENWFALLSRPETVRELFGSLDGQVGLCWDFGNWAGRYDDLAAIAPLAESCHSRALFTSIHPPVLDTGDYLRCLQILVGVNFAGPLTLIPWGDLQTAEDEWEMLRLAREATLPFVAE